MSSDKDSDSAAHQSHDCQEILDLLKLRSQQRLVTRRLYDEIPAAPRRSLKVEKLLQQVPKNDNALCEKSVNNIDLSNHNRCRKQHKSIVCSTPFTINLKPNFGISLSPIKGNIVQNAPAIVFVDETRNEEEAEINEVIEPQVNLSVVQSSEEVQRTLDFPKNQNKSVHREMPPVSKFKSGISKSTNLSEGNYLLHLGTNELAGSSDRYCNTGTMQKSTNCDVDLPKPGHPRDRPIRSRTRGSTLTNTKKLLSKPTSDLLNPDNDSSAYPINSKPKSNTPAKPKQNSLLLDALISHPTDKTGLTECSAACAEINPVIIPETQNNEIQITNIETVETQHQFSETNPNQHSQKSNKESLTTDNSASASHKVSNSRDPGQNRELAPKQVRKKKISDSYLRFLNLEQSGKRKSSISGVKRKLYSSEQASQIPPEYSESDSTRTNRSFKKITPTKIRLSPALDSDGFKMPTTSPPRTTKSKHDKVDDPIDETSELGVIAENIRILNKSRVVLTPNKRSQIKTQTTYQSPQKQPKKATNPKNAKPKVKNANVPKIHQTMEQDSIGIRRSNRVRQEPMTFWKVHREPISDNRAEFYNKMFLNRSSKSKPVNKRQVKTKRPTVQHALVESDINEEPDVQLPNSPSPEISTTTTSRPDSGLQESTESEKQTNPFMRFLKKFTASDNNSAQRNDEIPIQSGLDFVNIDKLDFQKFSDLPGIEFAFVPNTNETLGFLKLQAGSKKNRSRSSRKYFLSFMLLTDSSVTVSVNKTIIEMALGKNDFIQLPPYSSYELINKSSEIAILMSIRSQVEKNETKNVQESL